ncbi:MAG: hypothetical protein IT562_08530 [Alphaproteobacteria bacterium]|nr:hypothetical protein [Alphaproteobacteria bacterium]
MSIRFDHDWLHRDSGDAGADFIIEAFDGTRVVLFRIERLVAMANVPTRQSGAIANVLDGWGEALKRACVRAYARGGTDDRAAIRVGAGDFAP